MTVVLFAPWVTAHITTFITGLTAALGRLVLGVNIEVESRVGTQICPHIHHQSPWSWKVMEFRKTIFQAWKVMENSDGHGKSWKMMVMTWNF